MIRLLVLSDIHNQKITLKEILITIEKLNEKLDYCLIAGDITNFGTVEDMENILNQVLEKIPKTF
jgi:predicted phosphodiesterase